MNQIMASLFKYSMILIIYGFIFAVLRLMYLDIRYIKKKNAENSEISRGAPYLKLINLRDSIGFKVNEVYRLAEKNTIGRDKSNNICLETQYLSKSHAQIIKNNNEYYIQDMNSKNGTNVNHERISNSLYKLKNGDIVELGQISFLFVCN